MSNNQEVLSRFKELVVDIPLEYLEIGEEIMDEARLSLGKALNDNIYISMVNHIYTAVVRVKRRYFSEECFIMGYSKIL